MKDPKSGRLKKYIHEIKITFKLNESVEKKCDQIISKETTYLNPAFIAKSQVSPYFLNLNLIALQVLYLLQKLYDNFTRD